MGYEYTTHDWYTCRMHHMARWYTGRHRRNNIELIRNGISRRVDMRYFVRSHRLFFMNRKLAATAATAVIFLLMPTATAVLLLLLPVCPACLPVCLLACLLDLSISIRKFVLSSPRGEIGLGDVCRVPPASVRHVRAIKIQGPDRAGIVEGSCGYRVRGVSIRRKFVLSRNLGYKTRGIVK